jgi:hypothetical protein
MEVDPSLRMRSRGCRPLVTGMYDDKDVVVQAPQDVLERSPG